MTEPEPNSPAVCGDQLTAWTCTLPPGPHPQRQHVDETAGTWWQQTAILAPAVPPRGPQDAPTADGTGTETPEDESGAQTAAQALADQLSVTPEEAARAGQFAQAVFDQPPTALRGRLAEALDGATMVPTVIAGERAMRIATGAELADAVMAVVDRYVEQLAAGRETALRKARKIEADRDRLATRAERAEAQVRAVQTELTALNGEVHGLTPVALAGRRDAVTRIRAALDGATPPA